MDTPFSFEPVGSMRSVERSDIHDFNHICHIGFFHIVDRWKYCIDYIVGVVICSRIEKVDMFSGFSVT